MTLRPFRLVRVPSSNYDPSPHWVAYDRAGQWLAWARTREDCIFQAGYALGAQQERTLQEQALQDRLEMGGTRP